uniref:F-box/LRR-repeat protein 6 isoform X2 n=1 Tax=Jaculus jaculus TaxID=51337 RepID=UPI001E1B50F4|nr:F-box/LRR-repeat protein 6 isoform X2 [Jaculus jaculus]
MAPAASRRSRRRVRSSARPGTWSRSAEDWWWERLAPRGSGYHLLQTDSMLLVMPGLEPSRARPHRRATRRAPRPLARSCTATAKLRARPRPEPTPEPGPDAGWGDRIPVEVLVQIFELLVASDGPVPFLGRAARVCRLWHEASSHPALWHTVTLSPPVVGRAAKGSLKAEKKLLASLEWLIPNRCSQLQRLTLIHWKSQVHAVLKGSCCPQLQVLEVSTGMSCNNTPLHLPVEALQKGCPQLQVLRLLNLIWLPKPCVRGVAPGPGFPRLEELCLAGSVCTFVSNDVLARLLHGSPNLRLLDLRGCSRVTPAGLCSLPCQELEQLHLGLYGILDWLTPVKEGSSLLTQKWHHTLRELDFSGQAFSENDLERALTVFSGSTGVLRPALCSLNLRGTRVTPNTVSCVISSCPGLLYLNLESCRCLPRGLKRVYRGLEEIHWCLEQLLTSPPSPR